MFNIFNKKRASPPKKNDHDRLMDEMFGSKTRKDQYKSIFKYDNVNQYKSIHTYEKPNRNEVAVDDCKLYRTVPNLTTPPLPQDLIHILYHRYSTGWLGNLRQLRNNWHILFPLGYSTTIFTICLSKSNVHKTESRTPLAILLIFVKFPFIKKVKDNERMIIYRLGRILPEQKPGYRICFPLVDSYKKISTAQKEFSVPNLQVINALKKMIFSIKISK